MAARRAKGSKASKATSKKKAKQKPLNDHFDTVRARLDELHPTTAAVREVPNAAGTGRPTKEVDGRVLAGLAAIQCTYTEIAAVLGLDESTLRTKYSEVIEKERSVGKSSLRRAQFATALKGNATMQIWLGKNYLDQKDKHEVEVGDGVIPMLVIRREDIGTEDETAAFGRALDGALDDVLDNAFIANTGPR